MKKFILAAACAAFVASLPMAASAQITGPTPQNNMRTNGAGPGSAMDANARMSHHDKMMHKKHMMKKRMMKKKMMKKRMRRNGM